MASYDNLASLDSWYTRPVVFPDAWISEAYAREAETLTKALQMSLCKTADTADTLSPFLDLIANPCDVAAAAPATPTGSSEPETPQARRHRAAGPTGKVSKRKSRATKRSQTTFITADPANFRQMVQQVTGVRFAGPQVAPAPLVRPEPHRPSLAGTGGCLPTLDTSAFLLDRYQRAQEDTGRVGVPGGQAEVRPEPVLVPEPVGADGPGCGFDFEAFSCFPTLESWKVVS